MSENVRSNPMNCPYLRYISRMPGDTISSTLGRFGLLGSTVCGLSLYMGMFGLVFLVWDYWTMLGCGLMAKA
jgi:hypothetical protein